jgi:hypothetical protein
VNHEAGQVVSPLDNSTCEQPKPIRAGKMPNHEWTRMDTNKGKTVEALKR